MFSHSAPPAARQKAVQKLIADLSADDRPILIGPWRSEVGFEALYFLPFLRKLAKAVPHFDQRASVITRGGLAPLYSKLAHQGMDLYALRSLTEIRRENLYDAQHTRDSHGNSSIKQLAVTRWDEDVLQDAADELGVAMPYHVVHPAWMYWALAPYWDEKAGLGYLHELADFTPLPKPTVDANLPPAYVAVKFYARATFPYPHPEIAEFVQQTVATIAAQVPVVLLNSGSSWDDHMDLPIAGPNISTLPADVPPEENLLVQAAVIAHAKAFVGTYGGVAQLALRLGVPSASFYADWGGTAHAHLALSSWLSKATKVPFVAGSLSDALFMKQLVMVPDKPHGMVAA